MTSVWDKILSWGQGVLDGVLDFFTLGGASLAANEALQDEYEPFKKEAEQMLKRLDADKINLAKLKDALLNRKSDLLNSILSSSPFGQQYENMKSRIKQVNMDLGMADGVENVINRETQKATDHLNDITSKQSEQGFLNQIIDSSKIKKPEYDTKYSGILQDMSERIKPYN